MSTQNKISARVGCGRLVRRLSFRWSCDDCRTNGSVWISFPIHPETLWEQVEARIKAHTQPDGEVIEMALCEAGRLMLRPNVLYRFTVRDGCKACADAAAPYSPNAADQQRVPESP